MTPLYAGIASCLIGILLLIAALTTIKSKKSSLQLPFGVSLSTLQKLIYAGIAILTLLIIGTIITGEPV